AEYPNHSPFRLVTFSMAAALCRWYPPKADRVALTRVSRIARGGPHLISDKASNVAVKVDEAAAEKTIAMAKQAGVKIVDVKFVDLPGMWQHFSIPVQDLNMDLFKEGIGFDGSSIRGFQKINESDMLLFPDPASAFVDPVLKVPTLSIICDVADPISHTYYQRDPRFIARKAEQHLIDTGVAT